MWTLAAGDDVLAPYGLVVESVNVSVAAYVPVRSASFASMCCANPMSNTSFDPGAPQPRGPPTPCGGDASETAPLVGWSAPEPDGAASPAVDAPAALGAAE